MSEFQELFQTYQTLQTPLTAKCFKDVGQAVGKISQFERDVVFEKLQPKEVHLQLLKLRAARTSGYYNPLLDGLKDECTDVSKFSLNSRQLFCNNTQLLDESYLLPLLEVVPKSTRNRLVWNLGKYVQTESVADALYHAVAKVWGSCIAQPLLCQCSKEIIEQQLPHIREMSKCHLLIIAKRFPYVALSLIVQPSFNTPPKAAKYIVRNTIPNSLDYLMKRGNKDMLSKSTMKLILREHSDVILGSPHSWVGLLDPVIVKKVLRPNQFELFLIKQLVDLEDLRVSHVLMPYFRLLSPHEVSAVLSKVLQQKYECSLTSRLEFWEENRELLKLLNASDRSLIAVELDKKVLSNEWVPFMTTDLSIPKIKGMLFTEQDADKRANLIEQMIESVKLNNDKIALENLCNLVVDRYINDKDVVEKFFNFIPDLSFVSAETWSLVYALATKLYLSDNWRCRCAGNLFITAIKRDGKSGLKAFLDSYIDSSMYFSLSNLNDIDSELRMYCITEVFTSERIENKVKRARVTNFFSLITEWLTSSSVRLPLITENVKKCVLLCLDDDHPYNSYQTIAIEFVCKNLRVLDLHFIEKCFQFFQNPQLLQYLLHKDSMLATSKEISIKIGSKIIQSGVDSYIKLLTKMRKLGHVDFLQHLAVQCKSNITDSSVTNCKYAIILLILSTDLEDFFSVVDPLLPDVVSQDETPDVDGDGSKKPKKISRLTFTNRQESIYYGIGKSLLHIYVPSLAVERLLRFCVSGDLVLYVCDTLYSLCNTLPNETALKMLILLLKQPVSVKKHALRLIQVISSIETKDRLAIERLKSETHLTLRIIAVHAAITCLNESKSVSVWQALKEVIVQLTSEDKAMVQELIKLSVPEPFLEEYFHLLLEKSKIQTDLRFSSCASSILRNALCFVKSLSEVFIENLILEYFLSNVFEDDIRAHAPIGDLFLHYLQGIPRAVPIGSVDPTSSVVCVGTKKPLEERQKFLMKILETSADDSMLDRFSTKLGYYPVRELLTPFVESLCGQCMDTHIHMNTKSVYDISDYIDTLLLYFGQRNEHTMFWSFMYVSLTKIFHTHAHGSGYVIGQHVGDFCDSLSINNSAPLYCYNLPDVIAEYFKMFVPYVSHLNSIDILKGMLSPLLPISKSIDCLVGQNIDFAHMLRLMTVAHILPSDWKVNSKYDDFNKDFFILIKSTPVEVYLFNSH